MRDGRHYLHQARKSRALFVTDAVTGSAKTLLDEARIRKALSEPGLDTPNPESAALRWFRLRPDERPSCSGTRGTSFFSIWNPAPLRA